MAGPLLTQVAESTPFDNSTNGFTADNVQAAIEEVQAGIKNTFFVRFIHNGSSNNDWLDLGNLVYMNESPYTTPSSVDILRVAVTNQSGGTSGSPLITKITAYYKSFTATGDITTSDSIAWYVQTNGTNIVSNSEYGRAWIYDTSGESATMLESNKYALRVEKISGSGTLNDVSVTLKMREI